MTFKEYIKLAMRTNISEREFEDNLLNGILGLVGETCEFYNTNYGSEKELIELGDVYWYIALLTHTLGVELKSPIGSISFFGADTSILYDITIVIGNISDNIKKHIFQGHSLNEVYLVEGLSTVKHMFDAYCEDVLEIEPSKVWELNIDKLKMRFPEGFEIEKSINREE